jgi:Family of unknown function (DUF6459)
MPAPPPTSPGEPHCADSGPAGGAVLPLVPGFARRPAKKRPLPDAAAVRLLGVPDSAPPYDDVLAEAGSRGRRGEARPRQSALEPRRPRATARRGTSPRPTPTPQRETSPPLAATPGPEPAQRAAQDRPSPPSGPPLPRRRPTAAAAWPSQFAQVLAETLAGSRPPGQIRPWTSEQARRRIRQLGPRLAAEVQPRVRRVMTSRPAAGVVEMTVIVGFGPRTRVLAVRLECDGTPYTDASSYRRPGPHRSPGPYRSPGPAPTPARWICTAIEAA